MIILIGTVASMGNMLVIKGKYENEIKETIKYGLNNLEQPTLSQKLKTLLLNNIDGDVTIDIDNKRIKINVKYNNDNLFSFMTGGNQVDLTYTGYFENEEIKIIKG